MRTRIKIYVASVTTLLVMSALVALGSQSAIHTATTVTQFKKHLIPEVRYLEQMRFGVIRVVSSTSELMLAYFTGGEEGEDAKQEELALIQQGQHAFFAASTALEVVVGDTHVHRSSARAYSLSDLVAGFRSLNDQSAYIVAMLANEPETAQLAEAKEAFEEQEMRVLGLIDRALDDTLVAAEASSLEISETNARLHNYIRALGALAVLVLIYYSYFVMKAIAREAGARHSAEQLAEELGTEVERRKRTEARLATHQKMEALGTMLGGLAHSVNNFLTPIITLSKILRDDLPKEAAQQKDLEHILRSATNASKLLKDVLAFSRSRGDRAVGPNDLVAATRKALAVTGPAMPKGLQLREDISVEQAWVDGRAEDLETIVLNLIGNASDAMGRNSGAVFVRIAGTHVEGGVADGCVVRIADGPVVRLSCEDNGPGVPEAVMPHIFDPFFTTKGVGDGSGLGLSVTYGLVTDMGGDIVVSNLPTGGCRFDLFIPVVECQEPGITYGD